MVSACNGSEVGGQRLPPFPAARARHVEGTEELSAEAVDAYLYLTTTQSTGHTSGKGTWQILAEMDVLQLDIVAIMDISDIDAHLVVLLGLHAL